VLKEAHFTEPFCTTLLAEYKTVKDAADAIHEQCVSHTGRPVSSRRVQEWISAQVGPRRYGSDRPQLAMARPMNPEHVNRIAELLEKANIDPETIGAIRASKLKSWGVFAKLKTTTIDPDTGKKVVTEVPHTEGLYGTEVSLEPPPLFDAIPRESKIVAYKPAGIRNAAVEKIAIIGDQQLGFWAVRDPQDPKKFNFVPFHDEAAIDVMMQALALYQPDRVVIIGDFIDLPQLSRFQQEPEWAQTLQATIQEAYDLLCKIRKTVSKDCKIDFLLGNHETRMTRAIVNGNPALYNLTRPGDRYPVYSVQSLLKFEQLEIECSAEYPSGEVWLAKKRGNIPALVATHADPRKKDMRADAIFGHLVLPKIETRQVFYEDGPVTYTSMCVSGCGNYSDTGDKVRLTRTNTPSGRSRMSAVPSFGTVDIDRATGLRAYGLHLMTNGSMQFGGKVITSSIPPATSEAA
jgi:hypothetical protein